MTSPQVLVRKDLRSTETDRYRDGLSGLNRNHLGLFNSGNRKLVKVRKREGPANFLSNAAPTANGHAGWGVPSLTS